MTIVTTSQNSPDTLGPRYTVDQLAAYIERQLGQPVFAVEISKQQILDSIADALNLYNLWRPRPIYGSVTLNPSQYRYLDGVELGGAGSFASVADVWFLAPNPVPTELFFGNLIYPTPLFKSGLDEYDSFQRWKKTWMRVTSTQPDWLYDEFNRVLYIHNPIQQYQAGVLAYGCWPTTERVDQYGAEWVKKYAFQKARHLLAEVLSKYSGAVPGPVKDLQLDQGKRADAKDELTKLEAELKGAQTTTPLSID